MIKKSEDNLKFYNFILNSRAYSLSLWGTHEISHKHILSDTKGFRKYTGVELV